jgi:hypothetical protein
MKLRKPVIHKLEAMEQCIEAIQSDLADVLVEVKDLLAPPPDKPPERKKGRRT